MERPSPSAPPGPAWTDADFDIAARLKSAAAAPDAPVALLRRVPWYGSRWMLLPLLATLLLGGWGFVDLVYPPPLVREAITHEYREATLRGDFQPDKAPMYAAIGMGRNGSVPGLIQLQRPCDIDGRPAYHLTTFIERGGGMVTILAFARPVPEARAGEQGSWLGRHWRFAEVSPGRTVLMLADNARVLVEAERALQGG